LKTELFLFLNTAREKAAISFLLMESAAAESKKLHQFAEELNPGHFVVSCMPQTMNSKTICGRS
jgi:hypothetical protein